MVLHFDGKKDPDRRAAVERGEVSIVDEDLATTNIWKIPDFLAYRKRPLTYAARINEPFEVDTLEGLHTGNAGDWLACGVSGELYPIDAEVFRQTYELAEEK